MYYNKNVPDNNDIVFVEITSFSTLGTYGKLLEYDGMNGFIPLTELDRKVFDPKKCFEIGTVYPVLVTVTPDKDGVCRIVPDKNDEYCIHLSYKKIKKELRENLLKQFNNVSRLYSMLEEFTFHTKILHQEAQRLVLFPKFQMDEEQKYLKEAENLYNEYLKTPHSFFGDALTVYPDQTNAYIENMLSRLSISKMIVYQNFKLRVLENNSLDILKVILSYKSNNAEVIYVSSPKYNLNISCDNDSQREAITNEFLLYMTEQEKMYKIKFELDDAQIIQNQTYTLRPLNMQPVEA